MASVFREKIVIDKNKPFVTLKAEDYLHPPTITWDDSTSGTGHTSSSATVYIKSNYFVAVNVIFQVPQSPPNLIVFSFYSRPG